MSKSTSEEEKKERNTAAICILIGLVIHVFDVMTRLSGQSAGFTINTATLMAYFLYGFLLVKKYPQEKELIIGLIIFAYFIPLINTIYWIPMAIKGILIFIFPILPIYVAMFHAGTGIQLAALLYIIFIWTPVLGITFSTPIEVLQQHVEIPWAVSPGLVVQQTTERISLWWYGTKKTITRIEKQLKGEPIEEDEEKEEGKEVALKQESYAGVTLENIEVENEALEFIRSQTENEPFMIISRLKIDSPTPINVELLCLAEELDFKQPSVLVVPDPGRLDNAKSDEKRIMCEFKKGLNEGHYNLTMSVSFNFITKSDTKQKFAPRKDETAKQTEQEPAKGPINIEVIPSAKAGKLEPTIVVTEKQEKLYGITKIANAWDGRIKEMTLLIYMMPKGIELKKIEGAEVKKIQCEQVPKEIPCYDEIHNVFDVKIKEKTLTLPKKREKELSTIFDINPQFKIKPLPETFSVILEYSYELKKSYEMFPVKKKTKKSETV